MSPASPESPLPYPKDLIVRMERDIERSLRKDRLRTDTIFIKIEALLNIGDYQDALGFVADRAVMARYRTTIDFLFCELFPEYAEACQAYYDKDAPQAKESISIDEARRCEHAMLCVLALAMAIRQDRPADDDVSPIRWPTIVRAALELAAQAPPAAVVMQ